MKGMREERKKLDGKQQIIKKNYKLGKQTNTQNIPTIDQ